MTEEFNERSGCGNDNDDNDNDSSRGLQVLLSARGAGCGEL